MGAAAYELVVFRLAEQRYALHLSAVERVVPVVQLTALPQAPQIVLGVVNIHGRVLVVADARRRFGLPTRPLELGDQLIIAHTARRALALAVDRVVELARCPRTAVTSAKQLLHDARFVEGVVQLDDGLTLIHDLDTFLSPLEEQALERVAPP